MKPFLKFLRISSVTLALSLNAAYVSADINNLNVDDSFNYATRRTLTVDFQVNTPDAGQSGLSFYSDGKNGLRLLFSTLTNADGRYQGQLRVPAALKSLVVKSRWLNNFKELRVAIKNNAITQTIDYK
jgi:hypothetical protein